MCLTVIGEAAVKIGQGSPEFVAAHPEWPWIEMRGMRNRIVHAYDTLEPKTMWRTVTESLPLLERLLQQLGDQDSPRPPHTNS